MSCTTEKDQQLTLTLNTDDKKHSIDVKYKEATITIIVIAPAQAWQGSRRGHTAEAEAPHQAGMGTEPGQQGTCLHTTTQHDCTSASPHPPSSMLLQADKRERTQCKCVCVCAYVCVCVCVCVM